MNFLKLKQAEKPKRDYYPYFKSPLKKKRFTRSVGFQLNKLKKLLGYLFFLVVVAFGVYLIRFFVYDSTFFDVKEVTVFGAERFVNTNDLKALVESDMEYVNIFHINTVKIESDLKKNFLGAKEIKVRKVLPDDLVVTVTERTPLALIYAANDDEVYLIDEDGYVLGKVIPEFMSLPKMQYSGRLDVGVFLEQDVVPIMREVIKETDSNNLKVSSMSFNPKYMSIFLEGSTEAVISTEKDLRESIKILGSLVKKLTLEGKKLQKVDLRYDKVIVLYD